MEKTIDRQPIDTRPTDTDILDSLITDPKEVIGPGDAKPTSEDCPGSTLPTFDVSLHGPKKPTSRPKREPTAKAKKTSNPRPPIQKGLTLKQKAFVYNYSNPDSPTFGNGTKSAILARIGNTIGTSAGYASDLIRKPEIASEISKTFKENRLTIKDRSGVLSNLLHQEHNVTEQLDSDGNVVSQVRSSNGKIQLMAIKELNRMDGTYARAESVAKAQRDAVQPLIAHYAQQLRQALKDEDETLRQNTLQATTEGLQPTQAGEDEVEGDKGEEDATEAGGGVPPQGVS